MLKDSIISILSLNMDFNDLLKNEKYIAAKKTLIIKFKESILSEEFKNTVYKLAENKLNSIEKENKSLKEIMPDGFENNLKVLVYNKGPEITSSIRDFINNEKFRNALKHEIIKFTSGLNPMMQKFINVDSIHAKLMQSLLNYINNPETMMSIVAGINNKVDECPGKRVMEFSNYVPYEGKMALIKSSVDSLLNSICEDALMDDIFDKMIAVIWEN